VPQSNPGIQAARASWFAPILTILCNTVVITLQVSPDVERMINWVGFAFVFVGVVCCGYALFSIRKYGYRGILLPAIVGLLINAAIVAMLINVIVRVARRAA